MEELVLNNSTWKEQRYSDWTRKREMLIINTKAEEKKWKCTENSLRHIYISHRHLVTSPQLFTTATRDGSADPISCFRSWKWNSQQLLCPGLGACAFIGKESFACCYWKWYTVSAYLLPVQDGLPWAWSCSKNDVKVQLRTALNGT